MVMEIDFNWTKWLIKRSLLIFFTMIFFLLHGFIWCEVFSVWNWWYGGKDAFEMFWNCNCYNVNLKYFFHVRCLIRCFQIYTKRKKKTGLNWENTIFSFFFFRSNLFVLYYHCNKIFISLSLKYSFKIFKFFSKKPYLWFESLYKTDSYYYSKHSFLFFILKYFRYLAKTRNVFSTVIFVTKLEKVFLSLIHGFINTVFDVMLFLTCTNPNTEYKDCECQQIIYENV